MPAAIVDPAVPLYRQKSGNFLRNKKGDFTKKNNQTTTILCRSALIAMLLLCMVGIVAADDHVGGLPLTTVQTGTVTGDLYISGNPPSSTYVKVVDRTFTLPAAAVATSGQVKWARLYVSSYCGNMEDAKVITYTTKVDWNNDGTYDSTWTESDNQIYYYVNSYGNYGGTGNDNSEFAGHSTGEPYLMVNDHTTRVTSDYLSWYDVTNLIQTGQSTINVNVDATGSYDGRIKVVELVVAYDDPSSTTQTSYWVNEGQDVTSYYTEDDDGSVAVGSTTFGTAAGLSGITTINSATLIADYMASNNGQYGFPTAANNFDASGGYGSATGDFTNIALDRTADAQGPYSGIDSWDVTSFVSSSSDVTLGYARYLPGTGNAAFYKIPLAFLVVKNPLPVSVPDVDLSISGLVNTLPASAIYAKEANVVKVNNVKNTGTDTASNIVVAVYASDVSTTVPVATTTIASLASGATSTVTLTDPTIRNLEGASMTYTAIVDPDNLIAETNEANNNKVSSAKPVKYNGYKGKGIYWEGGSNITTQKTYDLNGNVIYYTQPSSAYKGVGWTTRTETWTAANLPIPSTATIENVWLYFSYNWDQTSGGLPNLVTTFNGNTITLGTPYMDYSNFGTYSDYEYGLYPAVDVTSLFVRDADNTLLTTPGTGNANALYPSTLVVVYSDPSETRKQIFINEECDELGVSDSSYGTTLAEATAYAPFTGLTIDTINVQSATLHSFAGSAGPGEGNLLFNGASIATNAWQGDSSSASAQTFDVKNYLTATDNVAGIQGTTSGGMDALQQILVVEYTTTVAKPDLVVASISPNVAAGAFLFANEPNVISVNVTNSGTATADASTLSVNVGGNVYTTAVGSLAAGASSIVTVTDTVSHTGGASVTITATADSTGAISESDETNNMMTQEALIVYNNGYKGKRWTVGSDITTQATFDGTYDVIYSAGDSAYKSAKWTSATDTWTSADLPIPSGANVVSARLYQPYSYNKMGIDPAFTASFNSITVSAIATYKDIKGFGSYSYPYGLYVYDVTGQFNTAGNTLVLTPEGTAGTTNDYGIYGAYLVVVYNDPATTGKQIFINDEFDMVQSQAQYSVSTDEATVYADFAGVDTTNVASAQAIAILASAGDTDKSKFFFNSNEYTGFWSNYLTTPQIGFSIYDVKAALASGANEARFQSYDPGTKGDNMYAMNTILVVEKSESTSAPVAVFLADDTTPDVDQTVTFTEGSSNTPTSWAWTIEGTAGTDYQYVDSTSSTSQNPHVKFLVAGIYDVTLIATNAGGSDDEVKTDYITVTAASGEPVAAFTATPTMLTVQFTDTSSGTITSWIWDFGDGSGTSADQNPSHTYATSGTYTVTLTVNGQGGSSVAQPVVVSDQAIPTPEFPTLALPVMMIIAMGGAVIFVKREN